jgi:hypothetical protein
LLVAPLTGDRFELLASAGLSHLAALLPAQFGAGELPQIAFDHLQFPAGLLKDVAAFWAWIGG